ncbi:MAG: ABC transporter permease [Candidatus Micrarchaeia archaeon]|jgi:ABC-type multidrug transport system permease subunit
MDLNLLSEIGKDTRQFMREGRTLMLLVAAPLLVLLVMGSIFSGDSTLVGKTAIGICDLDSSNASVFFVNGIMNSSDIINYGNGADCPSTMEKAVRTGKLAGGLVIPSGFGHGMENGSTQNISMLLDNSRFQVSPSIEAAVMANIQATNQRIGAQFILSVWRQLDAANARLGTIYISLNETRDRARTMKSSLNRTAESLSALNIKSVQDEILLANSTIAATVAALDTAESNLTKIESNFADYQSTLNQTESDLVGIDSTIQNISGYVATAKGGMNCSSPLFFAACAPLDSLNASVESAHQSVAARLAKVRKAEVDLTAANLTIQEFKASIALAKIGANDSVSSINSMQDFVTALEMNRAESLKTLREVDKSLDELVGKTYELEKIITDSRSQISGITSRSPDFIIAPMLALPDYLFGKRPFFEFMLPSVLPLILMFVSLFLASTSLVKEKRSGTLARVYTSQVNRFEYAVLKVLSYTVLLIPIAILLALIASLFYHMFPAADPGMWFYVLQALVLLILAFVSLGVLIAVYSESEATAFLACLVFGLPLLFVSGLLFPFEFMPPLVAAVGLSSPLTQAIVSMQATILYHSSQMASSLMLLAYSALFTLLAALSLKK